ncbi:formylglycine-generating enzyme family protein [Paraliomyxa miuraensis]|uniref:formylglycine-generating enzyme family protein n=1 Tax=Paraliomyxa miuraensis TaxID=376150 RepID=UPI00225144BB|nr:SUMF1/EgtB/PvdO family nonheme iron enzyme [Paraliomyxa miuraensis]MCX4246829.1 formylglycine-generating enzyme family protein [Paraliomyxa miuraensis]
MPLASGSPRVLLLALVLGLPGAAACRPDATPTDEQQELVMAFGGNRGQACQYVSSLSKPYVVAWDEIKLNDLQRAIDKQQPLAVRYEGCSLELLTGCKARDGHYQFSPATMTKPQVVALRSATEAIAEFQIGGVGLEAHFDRYDELEVTRALGGTWEVAEALDFFADDFRGSRCEGATHVVHAVDVGAYRVDGTQGKAGGAKVQGGVGGVKAGTGAGTSSERSELSHKGDPERCAQSGWGTQPIPDCSTPLRLTLQPIRPAAERESRCPYGMQHVAGGKLGELTLLEFCLDTTEVTAAAYRECVDSGTCEAPPRSRYGTFRAPEGQQHPITDVSWYDATRYCESVGKRLPTAEEWEWAARGQDQERAYPWGHLPPTSDLACWNRADASLGTCAAGERPLGKSRNGVLDMAGNVAEWTATPFEGNERRRVVMGGSWRDEDPQQLLVRRRGGVKARKGGDGDLGFRCAAAVRPLELTGGRMI